MSKKHHKNSLNTEEYIRRARETHGDLYDYSKVEYTNLHAKVTVIDPQHGEFQVGARCHLQGSGHKKRGKYNQNEAAKILFEKFLENARKVHGNLFDYTKSEYKNTHTKILIVNNVTMEEFWQSPYCHLCLKTGDSENKQSGKVRNPEGWIKGHEDFISKAKRVHNELYDYSKTNYEHCDKKVSILDREFGVFYILPRKHIAGYGHPKRQSPKELKRQRDSYEKFLTKSKEIHCGLYDYSNIKPEGFRLIDKVYIVDPDLGGFWQQAVEHMSGHGHIERNRKRLTREEFISRSTAIHGGKYDYSKVEYKTIEEKIYFSDKETGEVFYQKASAHMRGHKPRRENKTPRKKRHEQIARSELKRMAKAAFIKRASEIHNGFYDYSQVRYLTEDDKVCIIDPVLGEFYDKPRNHVRGSGHPKRKYVNADGFLTENNLKINKNEKYFLYFIAIGKDIYKIGLTKKKTKTPRFVDLSRQSGKIVELKILFEGEFQDLVRIESEILYSPTFESVRARKQEFRGGTECFIEDISTSKEFERLTKNLERVGEFAGARLPCKFNHGHSKTKR